MKIGEGGSTQNIRGEKITDINIKHTHNGNFELWINDSLSYLTLAEVMELKRIIKDELVKAVTE
jgi:hypothetical protein